MNSGTIPVEGMLVFVHGQTMASDLISSDAAAHV